MERSGGASAQRTPGGADRPAAAHAASRAAPLGLLVLGLAAYSGAFGGAFVFDCGSNIVQNAGLRDTWGSLLAWRGQRWLGYATLAMDYRLWGLSVEGYHAFNLAVHLAAALALYALVLVSFRTPFLSRSALASSAPLLAFASAALFVSHPVQTQAVTYLVQRFTSLATLFYLLTVLLHARWRLAQGSPASPARRLAAYLPVVLCALLAVKSKEIAFTLPLAVLLYELSFFSGPWRRRLLPLLPLAAAALLIPLALLDLHKPIGEVLSDVSQASSVQTSLSRLDYLRTQCAVVATYLRLLVLPVAQNLDYDYPLFHSFLHPRVLASLILILALLALAAFLFRRSSPSQPRPLDPAFRLLAFGLVWFFLALSVESSLIPIVDVIFEHRLYLPSAGLFAAAATALLLLLRRLAPARAPLLALSLVLLLSSLLAAATFLRNRVWQDDLSLWSDVVAKSPAKARGRLNLGLALVDRGENERGAAQYLEAIRIDPRYAEARANLGVALFRMGRDDEAIEQFLEAVRLAPMVGAYHSNLALAYGRRGFFERAAEEMEIGSRLTARRAP